MKLILFFFITISITISCKSQNLEEKEILAKKNEVVAKQVEQQKESVNDSTFVNLSDFSSLFVLDLKYATDDNFLKTKVYDCPSCYLRLKTVKALIEANNEFIERGYKIKLFDCYRPLDVQKKMWKIVSNPTYVADPARGSIHNRGGAVDITLVDTNGKELDMGTPFDFFGPQASHQYLKLSSTVLKNRSLLKEVMLKHQFEAFESEWWHYNLIGSKKDGLSNFNWKCD
jgi:zinc D-Ala-D-Ala dipeptidase